MSVNDKVLDAIEMLTSAAVDNAKYNKTIQAQIIGCVDSKTGKYKCNYLDTTFYAYSDAEARYSKGTSVYVLIPDNDMSREKMILGAVKKLGEDYVSVVSEQDRWELISNNCCDSSNKIWKLTTDNNVLKLNDNVVSNNIYSQVTINNKLKNYIVNNADDVKILLGATIQTFLSEDKQKQGHYGIRFTLNFKNNIQRVYTLDENNMISNPYQLINPTRQFQVFEIDAENFESISSIEIFSSDFTSDGETDDIWFKDIQIYAVRAYTPEQLQGTFVSFLIPSGLYFANNENSKIITAQIKENGSLVEYNDNMNFYWGIEDTRITSIDESDYHRYLGNGWKWVNSDNIQKNYFQFAKTSAINYETKIKVAVDYNDVIYTKEVVIYNEAASNTVFINCSAGTTEFYYNAGSPILTCTVTGTAASQTLHYYWIGKYSLEDSFHSIVSIQNHPEQVIIPISQIVTAGQFKCSVYQVVNNEEIEVGTASITLTNSLKTKDEFTLVIYNKDAVFQYDEDGIAPNNSSRENPLKIQALSFELFNSVGQSIDINSIPEIIWQIPKENTLLKVDISLDVSTNNDSNYIIKNQANLTYDIETRFNMHKQNNQIKLTVKYGSSTITAYTNFTFVKEGDPGTNGTGILLKLKPRTSKTSNEYDTSFPIVTWSASDSKFYLNYGINNSDNETIINTTNNYNIYNWFISLLYKEGEVINTENPTVYNKWKILKHGLVGSAFVNTDNYINFNLSGSPSSVVLNNILQYNYTYNNKRYYTTVPISLAKTTSGNRIYIKSGYKYVVYDPDGTNPQYNDAIPFQFVNQNGQLLTGTAQGQGNITITTIDSSSFIATPKNKYDSNELLNGIVFRPTGSSNDNNIIFVPIHFMLNQYGLGNLNDWDGNSIDINTNGDYIISPQVAAGSKDNNNRFTGVVMGELKVGSGSSNAAGTGLFGFAEGIQTFSLDSGTGKLVLGKVSSGNKITIDPSGNMGISYSNGNFSVDTNGNLTAKNASLTGSLSVTGTLSAGSNFSVSSSGYLTAASGKIGNWTISDGGIFHSNGTYISSSGSIYNNGSNGYSYSLGSGGAFSAYKATITGDITATTGKIGGWFIDNDKLYSTQNYGITLDSTNAQIKIGSNNSRSSLTIYTYSTTGQGYTYYPARLLTSDYLEIYTSYYSSSSPLELLRVGHLGASASVRCNGTLSCDSLNTTYLQISQNGTFAQQGVFSADSSNGIVLNSGINLTVNRGDLHLTNLAYLYIGDGDYIKIGSSGQSLTSWLVAQGFQKSSSSSS